MADWQVDGEKVTIDLSGASTARLRGSARAAVLHAQGASFEVALFDAFDDQMATRYSLGCDWPKSLLRRLRPAGVSKASASRSSSFCSADCRTAPAKP